LAQKVSTHATTHDDRRSTNPAFNSRKLKLGTFQSNLDYGCLMADVEGRLKISWPNTVAPARLADDLIGTLMYLASPDSDAVTGQFLIVDNGGDCT